MRTQTDPVSETLRSLEHRTINNFKNSVTPNITLHRHNPLELTNIFPRYINLTVLNLYSTSTDQEDRTFSLCLVARIHEDPCTMPHRLQCPVPWTLGARLL
jgi:hypothetical protein